MIPDWFRVDCDIVDSPKVGRLADALKISDAQAIGHLVAVFAKVRQQRLTDGSLVGVGDRTLESWALWRGRAGRFATAFRAEFVANDLLTGWEERQAPLIRRVLAERDRAKRNRERAADNTPDATPTSTRTRSRTVLRQQSTETVQEQNYTSASSARAPDSPSIRALRPRLPVDFLPDLDALLGRLDASQQLAWCSTMGGMLDGMHGPIVSADALGLALREFAANAAVPNVAHFRGYVRRAAAPPDERPSPPGARNAFRAGSRESAGQETYDAAFAVATAMQEAERLKRPA